MSKGKRDGLLIAGGGLAGCLAAMAMARLRPEVPLLLVEEGSRFGGDQVWSFLDPEVEDDQRRILEDMTSLSWPGYYVSFPGHNRKLRIGYGLIRSEDLDRVVRETLRPDQYRLNTKVLAVRDNELVLPSGEKIRADGVVDARGPASLSLLSLGWRKSVIRAYSYPHPHRVDLPVLMDATVEQIEGFRFFHCVPLAEDRLLVEDVCIAETAQLDPRTVGRRIDDYMALRGWKDASLSWEDTKLLPIARSDDVQAFWRGGGARVAKFGIRGGFFHPSTGSAVADAVHTAMVLADQRDFSGAALRDLFEQEATVLWRKRDFHRSFNEALFHASVWDRRQIMDGLYHAEGDVVARFYAARLGVLDRRRISGIRALKATR